VARWLAPVAVRLTLFTEQTQTPMKYDIRSGLLHPLTKGTVRSHFDGSPLPEFTKFYRQVIPVHQGVTLQAYVGSSGDHGAP
jgi:hypothetical protein